MKTLYKLSADNQIQLWIVVGFLDLEYIEIRYGIKNGAMQIQREHVETNQSGRSLKEQMISRIRSRIAKQMAKGYRTSEEEARLFINKNELNLHKPMLAQPYGKTRINENTALRQFKYDGHRCLMTQIHGKVVSYSRNGKIIDTIDHITCDAIDLQEGMTLDGELYCHGYPLQTISSWIKRRQDNTLRLRYMVYDIVDKNLPFQGRHEALAKMEFGVNVIVAPTWNLQLPLNEELNRAIEQGYEGIILREPHRKYEPGKRSSSLVKVKKVLDDEFLVIGVVASADGWAILVCALENGTFRVSAPGTMENKRHILENSEDYIGKTIRVEYFSLTKDGIPFHPVAMNWRDKLSE